MTQSGCIHAPGENTQNMYRNTVLLPLLTLCNQCVQMLTFPPLTSVSMSLSPAAQSINNSNDRKATGKALVQGLFGLSCKQRAGKKGLCWAASLLLRLCCAVDWRMRRPGESPNWKTWEGSGAFTAPGGMAHLFKQPELSWGNENFHLCRAAQILHTKSLSLPHWLTHYLVFPQLAPGPSFPAYLHI